MPPTVSPLAKEKTQRWAWNILGTSVLRISMTSSRSSLCRPLLSRATCSAAAFMPSVRRSCRAMMSRVEMIPTTWPSWMSGRCRMPRAAMS
ncbi:MAG: hypothetical protein AMJ81_13410 [Phycisphaerae bacterium SM23_33]|nr:MAG: hypothetical protein AMJ81_13410 [Phycisphaerae bacterium SM23_33]